MLCSKTKYSIKCQAAFLFYVVKMMAFCMTVYTVSLNSGGLILILNQPIDKSSAEISPFFVKLPCRAASPPAVAFLDWSYFICRLCL